MGAPIGAGPESLLRSAIPITYDHLSASKAHQTSVRGKRIARYSRAKEERSRSNGNTESLRSMANRTGNAHYVIQHNDITSLDVIRSVGAPFFGIPDRRAKFAKRSFLAHRGSSACSSTYLTQANSASRCARMNAWSSAVTLARGPTNSEPSGSTWNVKRQLTSMSHTAIEAGTAGPSRSGIRVSEAIAIAMVVVLRGASALSARKVSMWNGLFQSFSCVGVYRW